MKGRQLNRRRRQKLRIPSSPDPTVSSVMEGVEVVKAVPPTAEGVTIVGPLNPTGPTRGGVLAAPMINCPPPDPAIDTASVQFDFSSPSLVTEIHAGLTRIVDDSTSPYAVGIGGLLQRERGRSGV